MRAIVMIMGIHDELHSIVAIFVYRFYANYNDISMEIDVQSKSYFLIKEIKTSINCIPSQASFSLLIQNTDIILQLIFFEDHSKTGKNESFK